MPIVNFHELVYTKVNFQAREGLYNGLISVRELFKNTSAYADKEITVGGWVRANRKSKQFSFISLNDGTYFTPVQVVYTDAMENFQEIAKVNIGAALIITGKLLLTPDAPQPFEIQAASVVVEGQSTGDYPMQKKRHSVEFLRTMPHLRPRHQPVPGGVPRAQPGCLCHP